MSTFTLPDLGEGLTDARVVEWHVKPGQAISAGDLLVSVETAKAIVDIPAPFDGQVTSMAAEVDDVVEVGEPLLTIHTHTGTEGQTSDATASGDTMPGLTHHVDTTNESSIVEHDVSSDSKGLNRTSLGIVGSLPEEPVPALGKASVLTNERADESALSASMDSQEHFKGFEKSADAAPADRPLAMPSVRQRARELGIALQEITASGPMGSISTQDLVQAQAPSFNSETVKGPVKTDEIATGSSTALRVGGDRFPGEALERQRHLNRLRMSEVMIASRDQVVPATVTELADIARLPDNIDITIVALQALVRAASVEPNLNGWFDHESAALQIQKSVHVAVAIDTPAGLYAPVLRDADQKNARGLRESLGQILNRTRAGELEPADMSGATITLSNFGSICGLYADLVVPPPTVAIVGIGRSRDLVVSRNNAIVVHQSLPISLTFNHRAITGGEAARFLRAFVSCLEHPVSNKKRETDNETAI